MILFMEKLLQIEFCALEVEIFKNECLLKNFKFSLCWGVPYRWTRPHVTYTNWALFCAVSFSVSVLSQSQSRFCLSGVSASRYQEPSYSLLLNWGGVSPSHRLCINYLRSIYFLSLISVWCIIWTSPWP